MITTRSYYISLPKADERNRLVNRELCLSAELSLHQNGVCITADATPICPSCSIIWLNSGYTLYKTIYLTPSDPLQSFSPRMHCNQIVNQCSVRERAAKLFRSLCLNLQDGVIVCDCKACRAGVDLCIKGGSKGRGERDFTSEKESSPCTNMQQNKEPQSNNTA